MNNLLESVHKVFKMKLNVIQTLRFNIMAFPLKTALRFPILVFGKVKLESIEKRSIELLNYTGKSGHLKIGLCNCRDVHGYNPVNKTIIRIKGKLTIGYNICISNGAVLSVLSGAHLIIEDDVFINVNCRICCTKRMHFGKNMRASWDAQFFDSNFHYTIAKGRISPRSADVEIGDYCWIGNRTTVSKGAKLPPWSILASNSLLNKDFSNNENGCLYGGIPAKYISNDVKRMWDFEMEPFLNERFQNNDNTADYSELLKEFTKSKHNR